MIVRAAVSTLALLSPTTLPPRFGQSAVCRAEEQRVDQQQQTVVEGAAKQLRETLRSCDWGAWDERAIWALEDSVPKFSLEGGRVVLWRRMSIEVRRLFCVRYCAEMLN
jgi:hypothetical protein